MPDNQDQSCSRVSVCCWPWCPVSLCHLFMASTLWAMGCTNHITSSSSPARVQWWSVNFFHSLRMDISSSIAVWSYKRCFRSCTLWVEIYSITVLSMGSSCCAVYASSNACGWPLLGLQFPQLAFYPFVSLSHHLAMCISPPYGPYSDSSRIDFTTSASSFDPTWLRALATAFSLPFWYLMLNVNPASDSTQQCQLASKLGVVKI